MKVVKLFRALKLMIQMYKENKDQFILLTQTQLMKENGLVALEMDMELKNGLTELFMLGNGITTELKVRENSFILTETSMKVTGLTTKPTDMEFTIMLMVQSMMANGLMIFNTGKEKKAGKMDLFLKENTLKARNTELVTIAGTMVVNILVTGTKTKLMALEHTVG
jgi:hypothetical protein